MLSNIMLTALFLYLASSAFSLIYLINFRDCILRICRITLSSAFAVHLAAIGYHHLSGTPPPITHIYSIISLVTCIAVGLVLFMAFVYGVKITLTIIPPFASAVLLTVYASPSAPVENLPGIIRIISPVHIGASIMGFLCFLGAFFISVIYVIQEYRLKRKKIIQGKYSWLPSLVRLDTIVFKMITVGFVLFSIGILLGTVWSLFGNGSHLFQPQHLFSIFAWLIYGFLIYMRIHKGIQGEKCAVLTIAAFLMTLVVVLIYLLRGKM
jgi:ABC-type uncharacterized transport system permease subunit